jgi:hypothetical protein
VSFAQLTPFVKYGDSSKVLTISNGKFQEVFYYDSIVRVGSVVLNIKQRKISHFISRDTIPLEATLEPEVVSRWLSPDPLAAKYPYLTPYNFTTNTPLIFIDPDGQDIVPAITKTYYDQKTKQTVIEVTINVKVAILVSNKTTMGKVDVNGLASTVSENLKATFTQTYISGNTKMIFKAGTVDVVGVSDANEVKSDQHLVVLVDNVTGTTTDSKGNILQAAGKANFGAKIAFVEASKDKNFMVESIIHELGHNFNLYHNWQDDLNDTHEDKNFMSYATGKRAAFSGSQLQKVFQDYYAGKLNKGPNTRTLGANDYSYGSTTEKKPFSYGNKGSKVPASYE